jgi:hypothetical protein
MIMAMANTTITIDVTVVGCMGGPWVRGGRWPT